VITTHSIKSTRNFCTNLNKILRNTVYFKNTVNDLIFCNILPISRLLHPAAGAHKKMNQIPDKPSTEEDSKHPCLSTTLQTGFWVQPRILPSFLGEIW